jgi:hypothetical protein
MKIKPANNSIYLLTGFIIILIITALRAFRLPNDWAEAHWLINYDVAFIKRALTGTIFKPLIYLNESSNVELCISLISIFFLLLFYFSLLFICFRIVKNFHFNISSTLLVLLFLTSPYVVMSAHLNGYTDNIIILLSISAIILILKNKIWTASIIIFIGVFIHENILLVARPPVFCIAYLKYLKIKPETGKGRYFLRNYFPLFLLPFLAFVIIFFNQVVFINAGVKRDLTAHLSEFDFIKDDRNILVPKELTKSFFYYLKTESPKFFDRIISLNLIRIFIPLSLIMLFIRKNIKSAGIPKKFFIAVIFSVLVPLTLHLIAWDMHRIWTYPLISAMLILWGLSEFFSNMQFSKNYSRPLVFALIAAIIFNLFIHTPLMDNEFERFSNGLRILMYTPPLLLVAYLLLMSNQSKESIKSV